MSMTMDLARYEKTAACTAARGRLEEARAKLAALNSKAVEFEQAISQELAAGMPAPVTDHARNALRDPASLDTLSVVNDQRLSTLRKQRQVALAAVELQRREVEKALGQYSSAVTAAAAADYAKVLRKVAESAVGLAEAQGSLREFRDRFEAAGLYYSNVLPAHFAVHDLGDVSDPHSRISLFLAEVENWERELSGKSAA